MIMNNTNNTKDYLEYAHKKKRVYDQMTSMHFALSDKYERMAGVHRAGSPGNA